MGRSADDCAPQPRPYVPGGAATRKRGQAAACPSCAWTRLHSVEFRPVAVAREAGPAGSLSEVKEAGLDREDLLQIYKNMLITRGVEERGHILYRQGKIPGSF